MTSDDTDDDDLTSLGGEVALDVGVDDTGIYAQTLSNTVLALVKWRTETPDERVFVRMQLKRLVDAQVALLVLYVDNSANSATG